MAGPRYVADPAAERPELLIEGLAILYHRRSGITHVVAPPVPELLAALEQGPADADEIVARLVATHDLAGEDALADIVAARLEELAAAGLVARA